MSRVPLILSDLIVAGATWHRMLETRKSTGERRVFSAWFTGLSLCAVVLRDGELSISSISTKTAKSWLSSTGTLYFLYANPRNNVKGSPLTMINRSISLCNILALVVFIENADSVYNLPMIITVFVIFSAYRTPAYTNCVMAGYHQSSFLIFFSTSVKLLHNARTVLTVGHRPSPAPAHALEALGFRVWDFLTTSWTMKANHRSMP